MWRVVHHPLCSLLACWLLLTEVGCATLPLPMLAKRPPKATDRDPVTEIVSVWSQADGRDKNGIPCRGFAGQIMFMTQNDLSVTVDGDVRIYLFHNQGPIEKQKEPIHIVTATSEQWSHAYAPGAVGPSYNVFIPYPFPQIKNAMCSLVVHFTPKEGPVIVSIPTPIELVSILKASQPADSQSDSRVETTPDADLSANIKLRKTTTIVLKPGEEAPNVPAELLPAGSTGDQVQFASYQSEAGVPAKTEDRIAELEQMVRELRSQQAQAVKQRSGQIDRSVDPPQRPLKQQTSSRRLRIRTEAPSEMDAARGSEDLPSRTDVPTSAQTSPADAPPAVERRPRHPLSDLDDDEVQPPRMPKKLAARRHLLDDDVDPAPRQPAVPSQIIRASESLPQNSHEQFESINDETAGSELR